MREFVIESERPTRFGDCDNCPLSPHIVRGYGRGGGIAVVGESPGQNEVTRGRPFVGVSGRLIRAVLQQLGQDPNEVYWTNSILCHSPIKPHKDAVSACNNRLHDELMEAGVTKVLLLGGTALQAFLNPRRTVSIQKLRGKGYKLIVGKKMLYAMPTWHPAAVLRSTDLFRDLVNDVDKFLRHDDLIPQRKPHVFVSWNAKQAARRLPPLLGASKISCDIETTGFSTVDDIILSVGFGVERQDDEIECHIIPGHLLDHPDVKPIMLKLLLEHPGKLIFHNMKFDLRFLQAFYQQPIKPPIGHIEDTLILSYILDERPSTPHNLKALARYHFDAQDYAWDFATFFADTEKTREDFEKFFYYQGLDCSYTLQLDGLLQTRLAEDSTFRGRQLLDTLLYPATYALMDIESKGVPLNVEYLAKWQVDLEESVNVSRHQIARAVAHFGLENFNPGSSLQMRKLIYEVWKIPKMQEHSAKSKEWKRNVGTGEWPTGQAILSRIIETLSDPVKKKILSDITEWRMQRVLLSTYVKGLREKVDSDGRLRSSFLIHGTATGRLSSQRPNLQNVPARRGKDVERAFDPGPGWSIVEADFGQLELRVLAVFSKDAELTRIFDSGLDIHAEAASRIFGKPPEQITDQERKLTKNIVFGVVYGRGAESIVLGQEGAYMASGSGQRWTKEEASEFQRRFLNSYPGMQRYFDRIRELTLENYFVETLTGRRRRFPFITQQNKPEILRQAVNAPIQGTASDICLDSLIRLHASLPSNRAHVLTMIHDSLVIEVRDDFLSEAVVLIRETMEDVRIIPQTIPFVVNIKVGPNWGEVKELASSAV